MPIQELPIQVANQIAAGEVVERPASVVKELIENAIDAGATEITIAIEEAGLRAISVTDNGSGMDNVDAELAFKRHATSKIHDQNDLFRIRTLGFRGEALPSIASVSDFTLETSNGEEGIRLVLKAGEVIEKKASHLRQGTHIQVENLFFNTPARLKYIKSLATELSHITDIIHREALGHPDIRFIYTHEDKTLLETNGKGRPEEVLSAIYGFRQAKQMLAIHNEDVNFTINGFISEPRLTRASKSYLSLFINGRYIKNYVLNQAITKGYGSKLMIGRFPIAVLYITLDPQLIDVNVHPTKQEVRISNERDLYHLIQEAINAVLTPLQRIPDNSDTHFRNQVQRTPEISHGEQASFDFNHSEPVIKRDDKREKIQWSNETTSLAENVAETTVDNANDWDDSNGKLIPSELPVERQFVDSEPLASIPRMHDQDVWKTVDKVMRMDAEESKGNAFPLLTYVGQIQGTYLACYNEDGMYLIDQHAAQERIKYEYYRDVIVEYGSAMQELLIPYILEYTQAEKQQIDQLLPQLIEMGIELEPFGANSYMVSRHPLWMGKKNVQQIIEDLIDLLLVDPNASVKAYREATAIMMSCKRSIKANHYLSELEAKQLLVDLEQTNNPYNCPHGRPVLIHFSNYEIERMFKRIQDPH